MKTLFAMSLGPSLLLAITLPLFAQAPTSTIFMLSFLTGLQMSR